MRYETKVQTNESRKGIVKHWVLNPLGAAIFVLVALGIYGRTLPYDLIFDDHLSITTNDSIKQLLPLFGSKFEYGPLCPSPDSPLQVRPLVNLTFALNYYFGKADPWGYRLFNVLGHAVVATILWSVISSTLRQPTFQERFSSNSKMLGFWAALIWLVHPTHEDTVVYLTQRSDLQMGLFYVLAIQFAIWYWRCSRWWSNLLLCSMATLASAAGMLCKEMGASAPAMIALYEWTFIGGSIWVMWKRSWILYVGLALSWLPIAALYTWGLGTPMAGFNNIIPADDFWLTQSNSFFHYWRLVLYPWPLILHYEVTTLHSLTEAWPGVLGLTVYGLATAILVWKRTVLGFVLIWFFAILSPTLIVPLPHEEIAERRMYVTLFAIIPLLTVFLMTQFPGLLGLKPTGSSGGANPKASAVISCLPPTVLLIASIAVILLSVHRLEKEATIWTYVIKYQPHNNFAVACQGLEEVKLGQTKSGLEKIEQTYAKEPDNLLLANIFIQALDFQKDYPRLLELCRVQYKMAPENTHRLQDLAMALEKNGLHAEAIERYREVLQRLPSNWLSHSALATLLAESGQTEKAILHFEKAIEIHPDFMNCYNLLTLYSHTQQLEKVTQLIPLVRKAALKELTPSEQGQVEQDILRIETQLRSPVIRQLPF